MLPTDLENIIYKMRNSMFIHEINLQILDIKRDCFKADDIYCHNLSYDRQHFWDNNHNVQVIRYKNLKINPINLDYITYRNLGFQWTYICNDCGEFLKLKQNETVSQNTMFSCNCCDYIY